MNDALQARINRMKGYAANERAKARRMRDAGKQGLAEAYEKSAAEYDAQIERMEKEGK